MTEVIQACCPTPAKHIYVSRRAALTYARQKITHLKDGQLRPYRCGCGSWHLTSMSKREVKALERRRAA